jgi:hypothetical protein
MFNQGPGTWGTVAVGLIAACSAIAMLADALFTLQ